MVSIEMSPQRPQCYTVRITDRQMHAPRLRSIADVESADLVTLLGLVQHVPDDGQRRRAVTGLIDRRAVRSVADALALIAALERESDRTWAELSLVRWGLAPEELELVVQETRSAVVRRRLRPRV